MDRRRVGRTNPAKVFGLRVVVGVGGLPATYSD
jgi:hypothetical protein